MYIQWAVPTINVCINPVSMPTIKHVNMYIQWAVPYVNMYPVSILLMYVNMYIQWAVPTINACKHVYPVSSAYY